MSIAVIASEWLTIRSECAQREAQCQEFGLLYARAIYLEPETHSKNRVCVQRNDDFYHRSLEIMSSE
jgi:hypothetical protein